MVLGADWLHWDCWCCLVALGFLVLFGCTMVIVVVWLCCGCWVLFGYTVVVGCCLVAFWFWVLFGHTLVVGDVWPHCGLECYLVVIVVTAINNYFLLV